MTSSNRSTPVAPYLAIGGLVVLAAGVGIAPLVGHLDRAIAVRYLGILMGLLMLVSGNALPKLIQPEAGSARAARLAGWLLVLGGLGVVALWVFMPEPNRIVMASAAALAIFALVLVVAMIMTGGRRHGAPASPEMRIAAIRRGLLFHILHGVMWAFAMLLSAALGYGKALPWLVAGFTTSMAILDMCVRRLKRTRL